MFSKDKFDEIPRYDDFINYWFIPGVDSVQVINKVDTNTEEDYGSYGIFPVDNGTLIISAENVETIGSEAVGTLLEEWDKFKHRPEYTLINSVDKFDGSWYADLTEAYEILLVGSVFIREFRVLKHNPDNCINRLNKCLNWLRTTDFYTCPASTQYHDSFPGGLLEHSLNVAERATDLLKCESFEKVPLDEAIFVSLVHDWCKIGLYVPYMRNVKDDATGQWSQVPAYRYAENRTICLGHGVSSLYMVMKFFNVSIEVASAIRHHMGLWNCPDPEVNELQQANRQFPLVHLIQFADQLSIVDF